MTKVHLSNLSKTFGGKPPTTPMDELNLEIENGEFLVLLGPSGCGKTTTLRCIAGLETPDTGAIRFGDKVVYDSSARVNLPPDKRSIGMVFQSYALWPHMTVRKNIGYPIKGRRGRDAGPRWVEEAAELVDCAHLLDRYPAQLSGGQQQRVALARGLVARPDLVLFDEPMSNLDARLRGLVRTQLHELHARLQFTAVFVTHDQTEALALADRMAIMYSGRFEQVGTPQEVFEKPATERVAEFIGMSNRLEVSANGSGFEIDGQALDGPTWLERGAESVVVRLRPEDVAVLPTTEPAPEHCAVVSAHVADAQFGGRHFEVVASVGRTRVIATVASDAYRGWAASIRSGDPVTLAFKPGRARVFTSGSGALPSDGDDRPEDDSRAHEDITGRVPSLR